MEKAATVKNECGWKYGPKREELPSVGAPVATARKQNKC
jgi:hypothetical protein